MTRVSSTIEAKVRATFSPQEAEAALAAFSEMKVPSSEGEWETTRTRVQAVILISAHSNLENLLKGVANSQIDWRDTLMGSGLGESNWPIVAKEAGFDIA
jgi:hypothetical protein